jgi:hypothetical protein
MSKIEVIVGGKPVGNAETCLTSERLRTWKFLEKPDSPGHLRNIYVTKNALNSIGWQPGDELRVIVEVVR